MVGFCKNIATQGTGISPLSALCTGRDHQLAFLVDTLLFLLSTEQAHVSLLLTAHMKWVAKHKGDCFAIQNWPRMLALATRGHVSHCKAIACRQLHGRMSWHAPTFRVVHAIPSANESMTWCTVMQELHVNLSSDQLLQPAEAVQPLVSYNAGDSRSSFNDC